MTDSFITKLIGAGCLFCMFLLPGGLTAKDGRDRRLAPRGDYNPVARFVAAVPHATFKSVSIVPHLRINGHNGMMIHAHFIVLDRLNTLCTLEGVFFDSTGNGVNAAEGALYQTAEGKALVIKQFTPGYASTEIKDLQLWVPTSTLHALPKGVHELKVRLLVSSEGMRIGSSTDFAFTLTL